MQQTFDFASDRGAQLGTIRKFLAALPQFVQGHDAKINKSIIVSVVRAIDDHAGPKGSCYCSAQTIVDETGQRLRSVRRALRWLEDNDYVVKRRTQQANRYQLAFAMMLPDDNETKRNKMEHEVNSTAECHTAGPECHGSGPECHGDGSRVPSDGQRSAVSARSATAKKRRYNLRTQRNVRWSQIEPIVDQICRKVSVASKNDCWAVNRIAALVCLGDISENDVYIICETIDEKQEFDTTPIGYLRGSIAARCFGGDSVQFDACLSGIKVIGSRRSANV